MQTNIANKLEELFEQATEDVSTFHWAVVEWPDPSEDYDSDYLLVQALAFRARSQSALSALAGKDLAGDYSGYFEKLSAIHQEAETLFREQLETQSATMENVLERQGMERLGRIEALLAAVRHIAEDGILVDNPEFFEDELRENAHDFLILFQDVFLAAGECAGLFAEKTFAPSFQAKLGQIENRFREDFRFFQPAAEFFAAAKEREYGRALWWLDASFDFPEDEEEALPAELEAMLRQMGAATAESVAAHCPEAENVLALAAAELEEPEEYARVRGHIHECDACLDLYLDARAAEAEARNEQAVPELPQVLYDAIYSREPEPSISEKVTGAVSGVLDGIYSICKGSLENLYSHVQPAAMSLQPAFMKDEHEAKTIVVKSPVDVQAAREGGKVLLKRPQREDDDLSKLFQALESEQNFRSKIFGMNQDGVWELLDQSQPEVVDDEIRIYAPEKSYLVWLMDSGISSLKKSAKSVLAVLNREATPETQSVKPSTVAVWIEFGEER